GSGRRTWFRPSPGLLAVRSGWATWWFRVWLGDADGSGDFGQDFDAVGVADAAAEYRIEQFHLERRGWADAADGGHGTAGHSGAGRHAVRPEAAFDQFGGRPQRCQGAFLVEHALAVFLDPRAQDQRVPVRRHLVEQPGRPRDGLDAELLGQGHAG